MKRILIVLIPFLCFTVFDVRGQDRDLRAERIVIDDAGGDGATNTITLRTPSSLTQNVVLTIPDPGTDSAELLLVPSGSGGMWLLGGNSGTTPGGNFVGTSDNTALHLYVNGGANNSLILNGNGSLQRDTAGDMRGENAVDLQIERLLSAQVASGNFSVIGGGQRNTASSPNATVSGGNGNAATGAGASIGGGINNIASGEGAAVGGGQVNHAAVSLSTIGGGYQNTALGFRSVVAGGRNNLVDGQNAAIGGGIDNIVLGSRGVVAGGDSNVVEGSRSAIGGGIKNKISSVQSVIPGGSGLTIDTTADDSFGFLANGGANPMTISASDVALFGNADLWLANNDGIASRLLFYEPETGTGDFPSATNYTAFRAGAQTADLEYVWPTAAPTAGQVLSVSGITAGTPTVITLAWANDATSTTFDGGDVPTSLAVPDDGSGAVIDTLIERIEYLEREVRVLKGENGNGNGNGGIRESRNPPNNADPR